MLFPRYAIEILNRVLEQSPVTLLLGPRQIGKTTLVRSLAHERGMRYVSFDDLRMLTAAQQDPIGFVQSLQTPVVFDEIQRVPELFLPIKQIVDADRRPGMFILTSSVNPLVAPRIADSLAGRMYLVHLWPLSQGELRGRQEKLMTTLFASTFKAPFLPEFSRDELLLLLVKGGYPSMQSLSLGVASDDWCSNYLTTLLQRDVQDLGHIEGLAQLPNLVQLLATRVAGQLNSAELSRTSGLPVSTLNRYLVLLEALFIVYRRRAWNSHMGKRLVKAPKLYFVDTALVAYLLKVNVDRLKAEPQLMGMLLENFVAHELEKQIAWCDERISCYHFRTQAGAEVDMVLENRFGQVVGIEVKASQTVTADAFKGLKELAEVSGEKFLRGIVFYTGTVAVPFGNNLWALPMNALWE